MSTNSIANNLTFIHLSDIHFIKLIHEKHNLDKDLRNEIDRDILVCAKEIGPIRGVLISGDIAYSGKENEFKEALEWLYVLTSKLSIPHENVWCVPGNHDLDVDKIKSSELLESVRSDLKTSTVKDQENKFYKKLEDEITGLLLLSPFEAYNEFAQVFECRITQKDPWWEKDFTLNDGSIFRLRGISSSLLSDLSDNDQNNKLFVGESALTTTRSEGVTYGVMSHHPFDWIVNGEHLEEQVDTRVSIQIFGHKHSHKIETRNEKVLKISAGAVHPSRREPKWIPRYNFIGLEVITNGEDRKLKVIIHPRKWNSSTTQFGPDYDECEGKTNKECLLKISAWESPKSLAPEAEVTISNASPNAPASQVSPSKEEEPMIINRKLVYQFLMLNFRQQLKIATDLELLEDTDKDLKGNDLVLACIKRAEEKEKLKLFSDAVETEFKKTRK